MCTEDNAKDENARAAFIKEIEKGLQDVREGKVMSLEEAKRRFEQKWGKKI